MAVGTPTFARTKLSIWPVFTGQIATFRQLVRRNPFRSRYGRKGLNCGSRDSRPTHVIQGSRFAMMNLMRYVLVVALLCSACSKGSPLAPTVAQHQPVWALSGQSNAIGVKGALEAYATIVGAEQGSQPISAWAPGTPLWSALADSLRAGPVDAFIWYQGENNRYDVDTYPASLDDLLARVRAVQNPSRIVICGLGGMAGYEEFRVMQRVYAGSRGLIFVPSEDLPRTQAGDYDIPSGGLWPGGDYNPHLTVEGYKRMAERIATALR